MRTLALAAVLVLPAACQRAPAAPAAPPTSAPAPGPSAAQLRISDDLGGAGPFSLDSLSRLVVATGYTAAPGRHAQKIELFAPDGSLYGTLATQVVADSTGQIATREPVEVRGTPIEGYRMTGSWEVRLSIDGVVAASGLFDLR